MWLRAMLPCRRRLPTRNLPAGALKAAPGGGRPEDYSKGDREAHPVRPAAEESLPLVMPQGNLLQVLGPEVRRQGN